MYKIDESVEGGNTSKPESRKEVIDPEKNRKGILFQRQRETSWNERFVVFELEEINCRDNNWQETSAGERLNWDQVLELNGVGWVVCENIVWKCAFFCFEPV